MVMPIARDHVWTVAEIWALPDDPMLRYECVDGELLVSPAPRLSHQVAVTWLVGELRGFLMAVRTGDVLAAPSDVVLDERTLVQPDVYVLPFVDGRRPADGDPMPTPLLVIEVLSPSTARYDRLVKRPRYQHAGMEYWIVDLDSRLVERWMPDADRPEICTGLMSWRPAGIAEDFRYDVRALMSHVHQES